MTRLGYFGLAAGCAAVALPRREELIKVGAAGRVAVGLIALDRDVVEDRQNRGR